MAKGSLDLHIRKPAIIYDRDPDALTDYSKRGLTGQYLSIFQKIYGIESRSGTSLWFARSINGKVKLLKATHYSHFVISTIIQRAGLVPITGH